MNNFCITNAYIYDLRKLTKQILYDKFMNSEFTNLISGIVEFTSR